MFVADPVNRLLQRQARLLDGHGAVLQLVKTGGERVQHNCAVSPFAGAGYVPARLHRREVTVPPVAPLPGPFIRHEVVGLAIQMEDKIAGLLLMGAKDRLQTAINPLRGNFDPGQWPADIINI